MHNYTRFGIFGILALVLLRVTIGWHFYMEGVSKVRGGGFSSEGFLVAAKGPLAENFQSIIWDKDGRMRLNQEATNALFENAAVQATRQFGFTDDQRRQVDRVKRQTIDKLNGVYAEAEEEIFKYWESFERVAKMKDSAMWNQVSSLRGQRESIEQDRMASVRPTLAAVDAIWKQYEGRLNGIANSTQRELSGNFYFARPGEGQLSMRTIDQFIPIFDMCVGILLMLGLLTPLAAWAGAVFLISVVLTQMPGYPGTQPTYYQAIEALALIVLATTDAGRFAGLDFIPWAWWQKKKAAKPALAQ